MSIPYSCYVKNNFEDINDAGRQSCAWIYFWMRWWLIIVLVKACTVHFSSDIGRIHLKNIKWMYEKNKTAIWIVL